MFILKKKLTILETTNSYQSVSRIEQKIHQSRELNNFTTGAHIQCIIIVVVEHNEHKKIPVPIQWYLILHIYPRVIKI